MAQFKLVILSNRLDFLISIRGYRLHVCNFFKQTPSKSEKNYFLDIIHKIKGQAIIRNKNGNARIVPVNLLQWHKWKNQNNNNITLSSS